MSLLALKNALLNTSYALRTGKYISYLLPGFILSVILSPLLFFGGFLGELTLAFKNIPVLGWIILIINGVFSSISNTVYSFLIITLLSPVYSYLSERIEKDMSGKTYEFVLKEIIKNITRTSRIFIFMMLTELLLSVLVSFLLNILGIGMLIIPFMLLIQAFFFGWAFLDYSLERHAYTFKKTQSFVSSHWLYCTLVGLTFLILSKIPYLGLAIGAVVATILATYLFIELIHTSRYTHE